VNKPGDVNQRFCLQNGQLLFGRLYTHGT
jgi:hypothetical protein